MKKIIATIVVASFAASMAGADVVLSSLVGDKDGFGITGMDPVPVNGTEIFGQGLVQEVDDPAFMDMWGYEQLGGPFGSPITYSHDFASLPGPIVSAYLIIQHAGMGDARGPWEVYVNGSVVGEIGPTNDESASKLEFFLSPTVIGLSNEIVLNYVDTQDEGFAINYSEMVVQAIPEPSGIAMIGLVSGGALFIRKRFII